MVPLHSRFDPLGGSEWDRFRSTVLAMGNEFTYALLTKAPVNEVVEAIGLRAEVGTLDGWTVVALDPALITDAWPDGTPDRLSAALHRPVIGVWDGGTACGLAASADGDTEPMMWTEGWEPPGRLFRGRWLRGWRAAAQDLAAKAGLPDRGDALGEVYQTGGVPSQGLLARALAALGLPDAVLHTRPGETGHLGGVVKTG